ncbi:MAG TPA: hypothetical protein DEH07_10940 [Desulfotomaculum sp.]|nr:hypothetical protein [Desulfotomaculum sp.]
MSGFLVKIIVYPLIVYISGLVFRQVSFTALYQPVIIGLILAAVAHTMEIYILRPGTLWISTAIDFVTATLIIYYFTAKNTLNKKKKN